jgi:hypothetical protein
MDNNKELLVTSQELAAIVRRETGIPVTPSRIAKDNAAGRGPHVAATFGKNYLYRPQDGIAYAKSLVRPMTRPNAKKL